MSAPQEQTQVSPLMQAIQKEIDRYQKRIEQYKEQFNKTPLHFIESISDRFVVKSQVLMRLENLKIAIESVEYTEQEILEHNLKRLTNELTQWMPKNSSSTLYNAVQEFQRIGDMTFREMVEGFIVQFGGSK